ncbi:hypothetical protein WR25_03634 isoform F [Diploscapter pachys]|uniref:acid phosphatase n=1 Tax=Diploscapter pachys TaxID=2018661 RepID=A0A2A2KN54_9BILA|nr:hypothetical protein WR25_03634 isoform B [Diploscapter pachys]PAV75267.1 hypothetical protein WR25_03634 isoform F [Diploscapter pachys]
MIKNFLGNFTFGLTLSPDDSQVAIYTYSGLTTGYTTLATGNNIAAVQAAIANIRFDGTSDRNLFQALTREESEVSPQSGWRSNYKHVLIVTSADANAFFAYNFDQLPYAAQWAFNFGCPGVQQSTLTPTTTPAPTQDPSVPCQLSTLNYDVYMIVDTSAQIQAADFSALKQALVGFVNPFPIGDGKTQGYVLDTINQLLQDGSNGQSLKLSLQAIQGAYLNQRYPTANKLIVYFTGNTNWDQDPNQLMNQLKANFTVSSVAVQWTSSADVNQLSNLVGGSNCVNQVMRDAERMSNGVFMTNQSKAYYHRGSGQLTDMGIRQAIGLGRELRAQLQQAGLTGNGSVPLLSEEMHPSQAYFQSFIFERNLMTLGAMGNAIFNTIDGVNIPVPIVTAQMANDYLTAPQCDCPWYLNEVDMFLSIPPGATKNLSTIEKSMFYIGRALEIAIQNKSIVNTIERAKQAEALHEQYIAGLPVPDWYTPEADKEAQIITYLKYAILAGVGPNYHKPSWISQRTGFLLYTITENMRKRVECIQEEINGTACAASRNLYVYSVHDTMVLALLDSMNLLNTTLGSNQTPSALAAIFFELWFRNYSYYVRVNQYHFFPQIEESLRFVIDSPLKPQSQ